MFGHWLHLSFSWVSLLFPQHDTPAPPPPPPPVISTIGSTPVPYGLDCVEDEVIYFTGPDTLGCVHIDAL
jgi:hypothetical protein